ncbi:MAG TPA: cytochrome-c oxidase, cbb3-type subunit II, partial [Opitutaceae bacterium]|nr:cytochrome-c oxidase, cbb3-type subunit II [Opitutaceae bacterium]
WTGLVGILLYVAAMWVSGITQGLMLNATAEDGTVLAYPNFLDTLNAIRPMMLMRVIGGGLYLAGWLVLAYNLWRTIRGAQAVNGTIEVHAENPATTTRLGFGGTFLNAPVLLSVFLTGFATLWMLGDNLVSVAGLVGALMTVIAGYALLYSRGKVWQGWYERLLLNALPFTVLTFVAVAAGGLIQIVPTVMVQKAANMEDRVQVPYTPLELAGRDIYIREGCYTCHSQMIRTMVPDVLRYGDYSRLGESIYDYPFQWGSRRAGPDLARVGGKYPDVWHLRHMEDPRSISVGSNMPSYAWLSRDNLNVSTLPAKINVQRMLGVPYGPLTPQQIFDQVNEQAKGIANNLRDAGAYVAPEKEIIALIAYLQKLGQSEPVAPAAAN